MNILTCISPLMVLRGFTVGLLCLASHPAGRAQDCSNGVTQYNLATTTSFSVIGIDTRTGVMAVESDEYIYLRYLTELGDTNGHGTAIDVGGSLAYAPLPVKFSDNDQGFVYVRNDGRVGAIEYTSGDPALQAITATDRWTSPSTTTDLTRGMGCPDTLSPPRIIKATLMDDLFNSLYGGADLLVIGTQYSSGCALGHAIDNKVYFVNLSDGSIEADFNDIGALDVDDFHGVAVDYGEGLVFATTDRTYLSTQSSVWALDSTYGTLVWHTNAGRLLAPPVLRGDRLYAANVSGELIALDTATGARHWTLPTGAFLPLVSEIVVPKVSPYQDIVMLQDILGVVYLARDLGTNAAWEWSTQLPSYGGRLVEFDAVGGAAYATGNSGEIYRINSDTGAIEDVYELGTNAGSPTSLLLDWLAADGEAVELLTGWSDGTLARFCVGDEGILRNSLGVVDWEGVTGGVPSYEDTDAGESQVIVQHLALPSATLLTHFEAVANGVGPCDFGFGPTPCFENMQFFLMAWPAGAPLLGEPANPAAPGKLFHVDVTSRLTIVRGYSVARDNEINGLAETSLLNFDLRGLNLSCPAPGVQLALMASGSAATNGTLRIPLRSSSTTQDTYYNFDGAGGVLSLPRAAVRIRGVNCAMPNAFVEAYFGQDPRFGGGTVKPVGVANDEFVVQWQMTTNNPGIIAIPEWSSNTTTWYASSNGPPGLERSIAVGTVGGTGDVEVLEARMPTNGLTDALFRLRLECP